MSRSALATSSHRRLLLLVPAIVGLSLLSCGREVTGPDGGMRTAAFALAPEMPSAFAVEGSGDVVPFDRVRVTLERLGEFVLQRVVAFPATSESVELSLEVLLPFGTEAEGIDLTLNMQYINAAGDTVFRVGPQTVTARPASAGTPTPVVPVTVRYVGTGADATFMDMAPEAGTVVSGTTTQFSATAYAPNESVIPNTPFVFSSPDAARVTITPQGLATWLPNRGTARIVATLPTGTLADTVTMTVALPPTQLTVVSGGAQSASAGATLEEPVVLRVTASDAVPVEGVTVTFAVASGGGAVEPASAVSDVDGLVQVSWTLGTVLGAQSITATYPGLVGGPRTVMASAGVGEAEDIVLVSGDGQSGTVSQPLASPLVVRAVDALGNGVAGVTVEFSVGQGGGSFVPAQVVSDANGLASSVWTLGASPGVQHAQAYAPSLDALVDLTATAGTGTGGGLVLWTGAVSNDWSAGGNWSTGVVPTFTDSAVIPPVATQPVLTATTTVVGAVEIQAGTLWMNGRQLATLGDFVTSGSGVLVMQDQNDILSVGGHAVFSGGDESGLLTQGVISVARNLTQVGANSTSSFQAGPEHTTVLQALSPVVAFANPGALQGESRFGNLVWTGTGTFTQQSGITVTGQYVTTSMDPVTHLGIGGTQGRYLEFGTRLAGGPTIFDNVRVTVRQVGEGMPVTLTNLTFRNLPTTTVQLTVSHPGGQQVSLDNVVFETAPTSGGLYLHAVDNAPVPDLLELVVNVSNATPATPGGFVQVSGGAVINWPASSVRTWIGVTSTDWGTASNWMPAAVPGALDDVLIGGGSPNMPTLSAGAIIRNLAVQPGATLTLSGSILTVNGDIEVDGAVVADPALTGFRAAGTDRSIRGSNIEHVDVRGTYSLSGALSVPGAVFIRGALDPLGHTLAVGGNLSLLSAGVLVMQDPDDFVSVGGTAFFTGGSTLNLLTNGVLRVGGIVANASGTGNPANSFAPGFAHVVQLAGSGTVTIDIVNGGTGGNTSHFANLDLSLLTGTANLARFTATYVTGQLISRPAGAPPTLGTTVGGWMNVGGVSVDGLIVDDVTLTVFEGVLDQFDNVTFVNFPAADEPFVIHNPGSATPFTMNNIVWTTTPSGPGARYMQANDTDGPTPNALVINLNNPTPASPDGLIAAVNGAVINWPMGAPVRVWTGAVDGTWGNAANWLGGNVPAASDSALIPAGASDFPTLDGSVQLAGLRIEDGASLDLGVSILTMTGDLHVPLVQAVSALGMAQLILAAPTAANVRGTLPGTQITGGIWTPATSSAFGGLMISAGSLAVSDASVTINGGLATTGTGTLAMAGPANVVVTGDAIFSGGNTAGLLTGGTLMVAGDFTQAGSNGGTFSAGPGHTVELTGNITQVVSFDFPDLSPTVNCVSGCFGTLRSVRPDGAGDVVFASSMKAITQLEIDADNILAAGNTLLSGGTPTLTATTVQAARIGFVTDIVRNAESFAVDSLIGLGNGLTLPANLGIPTRLAGSYLISGPHDAGLMVTQGALDVNGVASVGGPLVINANGWLRMQEAADTLSVAGDFTVGGNSPIAQLTGGLLSVSGNFLQSSPGVASFNADVAHKTRFTGAGSSVQFLGAGTNRFGTVEFAGSSAQFLSDARVTGDVIARSTAGPVTASLGTGVFVNGGLYDTLGTNWQPQLTIFEGTDPVLPGTVNGTARFRQLATLVRDMTFTAGLEVDGPGELALNGHRVSVLGPFVTMNGGRVSMTNVADTLSLSGAATFAGGASVMSAGMLELYGAFIQAGATNSFAPSGTHETWFHGMADQAVTFNSPGAGAGASHFNDVGLAQGNEGTAVVLNSDAWANGRLMTLPAGSRRLRATVRRVLHSAGADIQSNVEFDNVGWALVDGAPVTSINGVRFVNMDPAQTQFSIQRSAGPLVLNEPEFLTVPSGGAFYLSVSDPDGATGGTLEVQVSMATPASHGGFLNVVAPATVTGWPGTPEFTWAGGTSSDWATASNWSGGIVPGAADSVFIPSGTPNAPEVGLPTEIRTLAVAAGASLDLGSNLVVRGSVDVAPTASITASGGRLDLSSATGGTLSGALPRTRVMGGLFTLDGNVTIAGNLEVYGEEFSPGVQVEGDLSIGDFTLTSTGGLFVGLQGTFTMMGTGTADFATYVNFFGNSTAGKLTNGTLRVGTELYQDGSDSPSSFHASGAHVVEFAGTAPSPRIFLTDPDVTPGATCASSCFATLRSLKTPGQGGLRFQSDAKILGTLQLQADSVSAPGFMIMSAGSPSFDTPILRAGGIGHEGTVTQNATTLQVDSLVAWGVGQVLGSIPGVRTVVTGSYTLDNVAFPSPLEVDGSLAIANNVPIAGNLTVDGVVSLAAGDDPAVLSVNGNLLVRGPASALISSGQAHVIDVTGFATFAGGNSTGNLVTGRLRVGGNFSALATVSPMSFVADPAYTVEFTGIGTISVADPAQSTFGHVEFTNSGFSRTLNTDIRATGVLSLMASSFTLASTGAGVGNTRRIFADRAESIGTGVSMFNVGITARAFNSDGGGSINFNNFDPGVVQLDITGESSALNSSLRNATFSTTPTGPGRYVRIVDTTPAAGDGSPHLLVDSPSPTFHGGFAEAVAPATMSGWAMPSFRWTGAVSTSWTEPGNWSDIIVPGPTDSVHITDGFSSQPDFPGQVTLRALVHDATVITNLAGELTITERLVTNGNMDCDGGEIILAGGVNPVSFSGDISCISVRIVSGTAVPGGRVTVGSDLMVWGDNALLVLGRNTVVAPFFSTIGNGRLQMTEATDSLITQAATFGGGPTGGLLTDGVLVVTGNFSQQSEVSAESFAATGNHTTVFAGNAGNQQSFFATPGEGVSTSHFANVELSKGEPGTRVQLDSRTYAVGVLRTGLGAPLQELFQPVEEPRNGSVLFQSRGADVENMRFSNVRWSILDGATIGRMDLITFTAMDSAAVQLNIERAGGATIGIRQISFNQVADEGAYIRVEDLDGVAGGSVTVDVSDVFPVFRVESFIILVNGALLTGWPIG